MSGSAAAASAPDSCPFSCVMLLAVHGAGLLGDSLLSSCVVAPGNRALWPPPPSRGPPLTRAFFRTEILFYIGNRK
jgi:hypothetical protein